MGQKSKSAQTADSLASAATDANKSTNESRKSSRAILVDEISHGIAEYQRPMLGLLLSSLAAGLEIGFSVLLMAVVLTLTLGQLDHLLVELLLANMYSVGFILVIIGRSELFTEHTTLAVLPVLARRFSVLGLARVWAVVFAGNLIGCVIFTSLLVWITPAREVVEPAAFERIAEGLVHTSWWVTLLSAMLAGWLMGEMGWVVAASRDTISQIVCVWFIASAIGFAKLHHSIVGTVEVLAGVFVSDKLTLADYGHFILWTTLGNVLGGVVFVALIKYGHASRAADKAAPPTVGAPPPVGGAPLNKNRDEP